MNAGDGCEFCDLDSRCYWETLCAERSWGSSRAAAATALRRGRVRTHDLLSLAENMLKLLQNWSPKSSDSWWRERRSRPPVKSWKMGNGSRKTITLNRGRMRERFFVVACRLCRALKSTAHRLNVGLNKAQLNSTRTSAQKEPNYDQIGLFCLDWKWVKCNFSTRIVGTVRGGFETNSGGHVELSWTSPLLT